MNRDKQWRQPLLNSKESMPSLEREQATGQPASTAITHKAPGPRTVAGKQRSKYNARKHGIFSQETVLKDESRSQYNSVLAGLLDYFQPVGLPEELLVEKLATLLWRHRRVLIAEGAEIRRRAEFIEWDKASEVRQEVEQINRELLDLGNLLDAPPGLIEKIHNPTILESCIEALVELRDGIGADGSDEESDLAILEKVYGGRSRSRARPTPLDLYRGWHAISQVSDEERESKGYASPSQCMQNVLQEIDHELDRLKKLEKSQASIEASRNRLDRLRANVPDSPALERLLRYEASLDRSFDRTLSQLERLQLMRPRSAGSAHP